jgi:hypothetical protein
VSRAARALLIGLIVLLVSALLVVALLASPAAAQPSPTQIVSVFSGTVATTGTSIAAANAGRTALICVNEDAAIIVYFGGSTVGSTGGVAVGAGASITITSIAAVKARSASGTPTVSCIEERGC